MTQPQSVCFITPPSSFLLDERVFVSLGILKVAAALEGAGVPVNFLDLSGIENYLAPLEDYLVRSTDAAIGITVTTPQLPAVMRIAATIRRLRPDLRIILGGPHVTLVHSAWKLEVKRGVIGRAHKALAQLQAHFDILCSGDGEFAIFEALKEDAPNIVDGDDPKGGLFLTDKTFSETPFPARHLVDMASYRYSIEGHRATSLVAQLGCPFNCGFCGGRNSKSLRIIRNRSVQSVLAEVEDLYRVYGYTGFMCYDDQTEILTRDRGYVLFAELRSDDQVACLNPNGNTLHYEVPKRIISKPFAGELITFNSQAADLAVTPEHRMWATDYGTINYRHVTAQEMAGRPSASSQFLLRAVWNGESPEFFQIPAYVVQYLGRNGGSPKVQVGQRNMPAELWIRFMAWYLAEGSSYRPKVRNGSGYRICIKQSISHNPGNVKEIGEIITALGYKYSYSSDQFHIDSRELYEYLVGFGTSYEKHVPAEFKLMSSDLQDLFLRTYIKGDGHVTPNGQEVITSYSRRMRDDICEMAIKSGRWARLDEKRQRVVLAQQRDGVVNSPWGKKSDISSMRYDGTVYCVTVSTGIVLVRRNGKSVWCGNCYDDEMNVTRSFVDLMNGLADLQDRLGTEFRLRGFIKSELFTAEQATAMYRAGFRWLLCGFEGAHDRILTNINKRATLADNTRCVALAKAAGLKIKALMSAGHPGESEETIGNIRDWLIASEVDDFDCTIITTYPGTPYYDFAERSGEGIWTYTHPKTGDRLHSYEVDYAETADYYKGDPKGGYKSYVFTDHLPAERLVELRNEVEDRVRATLGIPFNPGVAAQRFEHSMGQGLPGFIHKTSLPALYGPYRENACPI
jgi:radical SAM superfamily enzyme YgiQ (UPF0313 family)